MAATRRSPAPDALVTADPNALLELRARVSALEADRVRTDARLNELERLARRLCRHELRASVDHHEDVDRALVAAIATATSGALFNSAELLEHGEVDPDLRRLVGGLNAKRVGHRLAELEGRPLGGFVIRRAGRDHAGTVWMVAVYLPDEMQQHPCAPGEDGAK